MAAREPVVGAVSAKPGGKSDRDDGMTGMVTYQMVQLSYLPPAMPDDIVLVSGLVSIFS